MDLDRITANLVLSDQGIWLSETRSEVTYPEEGNKLCFVLEDSSYWFQHRNECIAKMLEAFPPSGPLFDIGGGNGFVALGLQTRGVDVVVVEPGIAGAANARLRGIKHVICSTLEDARFPPKSLPAVGLFDVVEHIDDDLAFLKTVSELLIPGGKIYLTVPAYRFLWSVDDDLARHVTRYTLSGIQNKLRQTGFDIDFATYIFAFLPVPIFMLRTIPSKLGIRTGARLQDEEKEHRLPSGRLGDMINPLLRMELAILQHRRRIPFGGSCLVVARKR